MSITSYAEAAPATESRPKLDSTPWGYVLSDGETRPQAGQIAAVAGRFAGSILLMAALGLWVMPDAMLGADVFAMKLAAMVMFTVFGGWLFWAGGKHVGSLEFQIDLTRNELRVGSRDLRGDYRLKGALDFADIASVYLLRSKDRSLPTRLFVRIGGGDEALEVASGSEARLEALRDRLARDFARRPNPTQQPVAVRLARHGVLAA